MWISPTANFIFLIFENCGLKKNVKQETNLVALSDLTCSATACDSCLARSGSAALAAATSAAEAGALAAWLLAEFWAVVCGWKQTDDLKHLQVFIYEDDLFNFTQHFSLKNDDRI